MDDFIFGEPVPAARTFLVGGGTAADVAGTVEPFRSALGDLNSPEGTNQPDGRRQIDWDAAPAFVSDDQGAAFPGGFFNTNFFPRARGVDITTPLPPPAGTAITLLAARPATRDSVTRGACVALLCAAPSHSASATTRRHGRQRDASVGDQRERRGCAVW